MPIRKVVTILPRLISFAAPVTTPASTRSRTESVNISVWTPRSRLSRSASATAAGMAPMPIWSVAPIRHELGHVAADLALHLAHLADAVRMRALVDLDGEVDVAHMDEAVAERARHRAVELGDDEVGRARSRRARRRRTCRASSSRGRPAARR